MISNLARPRFDGLGSIDRFMTPVCSAAMVIDVVIEGHKAEHRCLVLKPRNQRNASTVRMLRCASERSINHSEEVGDHVSSHLVTIMTERDRSQSAEQLN